MKAPSGDYGTMLFDLETDPDELNPIEDEKLKERFAKAITCHMQENDAPTELYERMGLAKYK